MIGAFYWVLTEKGWRRGKLTYRAACPHNYPEIRQVLLTFANETTYWTKWEHLKTDEAYAASLLAQ